MDLLTRSLVANIVLNRVDARVELDGVLLHGNLLLDQGIHLLFEEVALVDIVSLLLLVVFLEVGNVLDDLLEDVIGGLRGVVLQCRALRAKELHFLLVVIQEFDGFLGVALKRYEIIELVTVMVKLMEQSRCWESLTSRALILFLIGIRLAEKSPPWPMAFMTPVMAASAAGLPSLAMAALSFA